MKLVIFLNTNYFNILVCKYNQYTRAVILLINLFYIYVLLLYELVLSVLIKIK